jgi:hypothetical protein
MAILVSGETLSFHNGLTADNLYLRVSAEVNKGGTEIRIQTTCALSKEFYNERKNLPSSVLLSRKISYNREVDGPDILQLAHNQIKNDLIQAGIEENKISFIDIIF